MNQAKFFSIKSTVELKFSNNLIRDYSYNTFLPDLYNSKSKRSKVLMEKKENILSFSISGSDITAFRAAVSDIIGLGKVIENSLSLCE